MTASNQGHFETRDAAFAAMLREARERKGITQEDLAAFMTGEGHDFHQQTIYKIERGKRKVTLGEAISLAEAVGVPVESLTDRAPELAALRTAYAVQGRERVAFVNLMESYTLALLEVAVAADNAAALTDSDVSWLDSAMLKQSPAGMTADAGVIIDAAISREGVKGNGHYVSQLRERVRREHDLLKPVDS
jgi:transcriptional regulator with XRE-family HTH domain